MDRDVWCVDLTAPHLMGGCGRAMQRPGKRNLRIRSHLACAPRTILPGTGSRPPVPYGGRCRCSVPPALAPTGPRAHAPHERRRAERDRHAPRTRMKWTSYCWSMTRRARRTVCRPRGGRSQEGGVTRIPPLIQCPGCCRRRSSRRQERATNLPADGTGLFLGGARPASVRRRRPSLCRFPRQDDEPASCCGGDTSHWQEAGIAARRPRRTLAKKSVLLVQRFDRGAPVPFLSAMSMLGSRTTTRSYGNRHAPHGAYQGRHEGVMAPACLQYRFVPTITCETMGPLDGGMLDFARAIQPGAVDVKLAS